MVPFCSPLRCRCPGRDSEADDALSLAPQAASAAGSPLHAAWRNTAARALQCPADAAGTASRPESGGGVQGAGCAWLPASPATQLAGPLGTWIGWPPPLGLQEVPLRSSTIRNQLCSKEIFPHDRAGSLQGLPSVSFRKTWGRVQEGRRASSTAVLRSALSPLGSEQDQRVY